MRDLLTFMPPRDRIGRAVRQAQIEALLKMVPATVAVQCFTAALMVACMRGYVDSFALGLWFGTIMLICFARGVRAIRLRHDHDYAQQAPTSVGTITFIIAMLAMIWCVVPVFWFNKLPTDQQLIVCVTFAGLMCAGSITLIAVPPAALVHIWIYTIGCGMLALESGNPELFALLIAYSTILSFNVISNARQFIAHTRDRFELREQGEIIKLLREFEAPGSGGLWELDGELNFVKISRELLDAIQLEERQVIGRSYRELLDPGGRLADLSSSLRQLVDEIERGTAFRDRAIPSVDQKRWWSISGKPIFDELGQLAGWRGVASDITDARLSGDDAVRAARTDPLTGLANRLLIRELLEEAAMSKHASQGQCALLLVDLDRFKMVNDTLGHGIGDKLLCEVARRLEHAVGDEGRVGRIGGDEFAIVWRGDLDRKRLASVARQLVADVSRSISIGPATLHVGASVGIAISPEDGQREEQLMRSADLALYRAKDAGRGGHAFFERFMYVEAEEHRLLEQDVRQALADHSMALAFQPIVDATTGAVVAREALLRWHHPRRGNIPPDQFIPVIEDAGLIHQIGDWVIREACAEAVRWPDTTRVAVNISAAQLTGAGLAKTVLSALAATGLTPGRLELEVTETVFLGDDAATLASLERLRSLGVRLVLDDFGKGYSSFGYLSRAHFSKIKIDQHFVRGAAEGASDCKAIVGAIMALARGLGLETTAEGVENERQAMLMRDVGCSQLQGYYFGRPVIPGSADESEPRKFA
nr:EAL domain-containing protein [uncultured Sphingomonas sp.]